MSLPRATTSPPPAGSAFNLTDAASVQALLGRALAELGPGAPPAGVDAQAVQGAAAGTVTLVNSLLEQVGRGGAVVLCCVWQAGPGICVCMSTAEGAWDAQVAHAAPTLPLPLRPAQAVATAEATRMSDGADKMVQVLARLAKVCQVRGSIEKHRLRGGAGASASGI